MKPIAKQYLEKVNEEYTDLCEQRVAMYNDVVTEPVKAFVGTREEITSEEERLKELFKEVSATLDKQIETLQALRLKEFEDLLWITYGINLTQEQHLMIVRRVNTYNYERLEYGYSSLVTFINEFNNAAGSYI